MTIPLQGIYYTQDTDEFNDGFIYRNALKVDVFKKESNLISV